VMTTLPRAWPFSRYRRASAPGELEEPAGGADWKSAIRQRVLSARRALRRHPHITELVTAITHDQASVVGPGCDDQFEFEFALDLMLDGLERLRDRA
jgi:hypothetical protein